MKKIALAALLLGSLGGPLLAQEKRETPMKGPMLMKEGAPIKSEGQHGGSMDMQQMREMHGKMREMEKGIGRM